MTLDKLNSWQAQINILCCGYSILMASAAMSLPYWPLYLKELLPNSPVAVKYWSSLIYLAPFVSAMISAPIWGAIGDKFGYKIMLLRACIGLTITQFLIALTANVILIFVLRLLQGAIAGVIVAVQAWGISISPDNQQSATIGKLQSALAIGELAGPILGGVVASQTGYHSIFFMSSAICLTITLVFYYTLQDTKNTNNLATEKAPLGKPTANGTSILTTTMLLLLLAIILAQLARSIFTPFFALFVIENIRGSTNLTVGILSSATAMAVFISAPLWGRYLDLKLNRNNSSYPVIGIILFMTSVLQILHAYTHSFTGIFIIRILWGICMGCLIPALLRLLISNSTLGPKKGKILGIGNGSNKFGNLLGAISGAVILTRFSYTASFFIMSSLFFASGIIMMLIAWHKYSNNKKIS